MPVLVLDGHSRAALEALQSLSRAGLEVDIAAESSDCLAMKSGCASSRLIQPASHPQVRFSTWLSDIDRERNYDLIVPATESSLLAFRAMDPEHPLRQRAVLPGDAALDIALDKRMTLQVARELGIPVPSSVFFDSQSEIGPAPAFPVILKPARSKILVGNELRTLAVARVHDEAQRREQLRLWLPHTPVLQQQYIFGHGVGLEFLYENGRKVWHFAHERIHEFPLSGGASSYRRSVEAPEQLLADGQRLLDHLGWRGVAMVEFKVDNGGQRWLMEINPRLWGSLALAIDAGVDFPLGLFRLARGETVSPQPRYATHFYTRDLRTDLQWFKENLRASRHDQYLLTQPRLFSLLELLRPFTGQESWDHFDWRDLGTTRRMIALTISDFLRPVLSRFAARRKRTRLIQHHRSLLQTLTESQVRKIAFICLGNVCRSPFAAGLAARKLPEMKIVSAGLHRAVGRNCPEKILTIARSFGVDLDHHRSTRVSEEQLHDADLVVAMDLENLDSIKREIPEISSKTTLLGLFASPHQLVIPDPYAASMEETHSACELISSSVEGLAIWLTKAGCVPTPTRKQMRLAPILGGKQDA